MIWDSQSYTSSSDSSMKPRYNSVSLLSGTTWLVESKTWSIYYHLQILLVPSAFTKITGQAHWEILLRARAIETQCYVWIYFYLMELWFCVNYALICDNSFSPYQVIAAAQAGKHNDKRESYGDTLIIDPWGTVVGRLPGEKYCFLLVLLPILEWRFSIL